MSSTIHGIGQDELVPSHDLELTRSSEGNWTGTQTYHCRYIDHANPTIEEKLKKGTAITELDPNVPLLYNFISLKSHRISHQRGGITKIVCTFAGAGIEGESSGIQERSLSFSYRAVLTQASILTHPKYIEEMADDTPAMRAIAAFYNGDARAVGDRDAVGVHIRGKYKDEDYFAGALVDPALKWFLKIEGGLRTYDKPEVEWTVTSTNKDGLEQEHIDQFGKKVGTPEGDPPVPSWAAGGEAEHGDIGWWFFSDLTEDKDENSSVFSRTYTLRADPLDTDVYAYTLD